VVEDDSVIADDTGDLELPVLHLFTILIRKNAPSPPHRASRLQVVDGLVPSLFTFFRDVHYLEALAGCMTRLTRLLPGDTVSTALARDFSDTAERTGRAVLQIAESSFTSCPAQSVDPVDLGLRQLHAYAMRHYPKMPRSPTPSTRKELIMRPTTHADPTVLREFAELAERLGFESPEITDLKQYPTTRAPRSQTENPKPLLVTDGAGVKKKWRSGLPSIDQYLEDSKYFFINHLHYKDEEQGEGITSFFVRKSIYSAFFGKSPPLSLEEIQPRDEAVQVARDLERRELERQELARQELERQELERQEQERRKQEEEEKEKQQARRTQAKKLRRLKPNKILSGRSGKQAQEQRQLQGPRYPNLEDERRLEDQQRIGMDDLFGIEQEIEQQPGGNLQVETSGAQPEGALSRTTVRITFMVHDRGIWKPASAHTIELSDYSAI